MSHLVLLRGAPGAGKTVVGSAFAGSFGWRFIELDEIKRSRGDIRLPDPGAFVEAGRQARAALDAGTNVVAEEYFATEEWIQRFLGPTGQILTSPDLTAVWLACDGTVATRRKAEQGLMPENLAATYNAMAAHRFVIANEIVLDTTSQSPEQVVGAMAAALTARGLKLVRGDS